MLIDANLIACYEYSYLHMLYTLKLRYVGDWLIQDEGYTCNIQESVDKFKEQHSTALHNVDLYYMLSWSLTYL